MLHANPLAWIVEGVEDTVVAGAPMMTAGVEDTVVLVVVMMFGEVAETLEAIIADMQVDEAPALLVTPTEEAVLHRAIPLVMETLTLIVAPNHLLGIG